MASPPALNILEDGFHQDPPRLGNQFLEDTALREALQRLMPAQVYQSIEPDMIRFGDRVLGDVTKWGFSLPSSLCFFFQMLFCSHFL